MAPSSSSNLGPGRRHTELGHDRSGAQPTIRHADKNRHFAGDRVHFESDGRRLAAIIGRDGESLGALGEFTCRTFGGESENGHGSGNGILLLVFHADDRLAAGGLANIGSRALALENDDTQFGREILSLDWGARKAENQDVS